MAQYIDPKEFDIKNNKRPRVLLLGNGLTYDSFSWAELIKAVAREDVIFDPYVKDEKGLSFSVPNAILTAATSVTDDTLRHNNYDSILASINYKDNSLLRRLLSLPWDAVLTTNYSYETEYALNSRYPYYSIQTKRQKAYTHSKTEQDAKYLLHTFNRVGKNAPDIWHIHGEARRKSSIILSHDEYARQVHKIMEYNNSRGNDYERFHHEVKFKSWVDYFILGDVYILGLSMDYSEFDLWWLLGRRLREKTGRGSIWFYEPIKDDNKHKLCALHDAGVDHIETCGFNLKNTKGYPAFYERAINSIIDGFNREI